MSDVRERAEAVLREIGALDQPDDVAYEVALRIAALVHFAEEQRSDAIDSAFSLLIERLAPFLDDQSLHAVHAECAKIEALKHEHVHRITTKDPTND